MNRLTLFTVLIGTLVAAAPAMAQEERSEVNVQLSGIVPSGTSGMDPTGNSLSDEATRSAGFLAGYRFSINRWAAVEAGYGYGRNSLDYSGTFGVLPVQANVHQVTGAFIWKIPVPFKLKPYALAGTGALAFDPTTYAGNYSGAQSQTKAAFLYGGGANLDINSHVGFKIEYRGLVSKTPDFTLTSLAEGTTTHLAEPSAGVFFRF